MNFARLISAGFIYGGLSLLKAAWEARVPNSLILWGKNETGQIMRREQRLLFGFGACLLLSTGIGSLLRHH